MYPYISLAVSPRSSVPDRSIWPMTRFDTLPYTLSKNVCPRCKAADKGLSYISIGLDVGEYPRGSSKRREGVTCLRAKSALIA